MTSRRSSRRYHDAEAADVVVDSRPFGRLRVHVVSYGPRAPPPLLLVHGLMSSSYSWRYLFEPLGERFRLIAPDLPGAGRSQAGPDRRHSGAALTMFLGELQDALDVTDCPAVGRDAEVAGGGTRVRRPACERRWRPRVRALARRLARPARAARLHA